LGSSFEEEERVYKLFIWTILIFILTACGSQTGEPELDPAAVERAVESGIEVIFYGEECETTAPEVLPAGDYDFYITDKDENTSASLYVARITEGHVYQDLLDPQEEPGVYYPKPDWLIYADTIDAEFIDTDQKRFTKTLEEGEHAVYIYTRPTGLWFCVPIMVVE
jgi:hypothetical protein